MKKNLLSIITLLLLLSPSYAKTVEMVTEYPVKYASFDSIAITGAVHFGTEGGTIKFDENLDVNNLANLTNVNFSTVSGADEEVKIAGSLSLGTTEKDMTIETLNTYGNTASVTTNEGTTTITKLAPSTTAPTLSLQQASSNNAKARDNIIKGNVNLQNMTLGKDQSVNITTTQLTHVQDALYICSSINNCYPLPNPLSNTYTTKNCSKGYSMQTINDLIVLAYCK